MNGINPWEKTTKPLQVPAGFYSSLRKINTTKVDRATSPIFDVQGNLLCEGMSQKKATKVDRATSPIFDVEGNLLCHDFNRLTTSGSVIDFIDKTNFDAFEATDLFKLCSMATTILLDEALSKTLKKLKYEILKKIDQFSLPEISQMTLDLSKINLLDKGLMYAISNQVVAKQAGLNREQFFQIISTFEKLKFANIEFFIMMAKFAVEQIPDCSGEELTKIASAYAFVLAEVQNSQNAGVLKNHARAIWLEIQKKGLELSLPPSAVQLFEDTLNVNPIKNQLMTTDELGLIFLLCRENILDTDLLVTTLQRLAILNKPVAVYDREIFNRLVMNGMDLIQQSGLYADHLCGLAYALVRLDKYDEDMLSRVESRALALVSTFNARHFGDITSALCQSRFPKRKFFNTVAPFILKQLRTATDTDLAQIAIAYEVFQQNSSVSFAILVEIDRRWEEFKQDRDFINMAIESAAANLKGLNKEEQAIAAGILQSFA